MLRRKNTYPRSGHNRVSLQTRIRPLSSEPMAYKSKVSPALFIVTTLCFLFPFVTVSCNGQKVATFSRSGTSHGNNGGATAGFWSTTEEAPGRQLLRGVRESGGVARSTKAPRSDLNSKTKLT